MKDANAYFAEAYAAARVYRGIVFVALRPDTLQINPDTASHDKKCEYYRNLEEMESQWFQNQLELSRNRSAAEAWNSQFDHMFGLSMFWFGKCKSSASWQSSDRKS